MRGVVPQINTLSAALRAAAEAEQTTHAIAARLAADASRIASTAMRGVVVDVHTTCATTGAATEAGRGTFACRAQLTHVTRVAAGAAVLWVESGIDTRGITLDEPPRARAGCTSVSE